MHLLLTLDALLFRMVGGQLKRFAKARKDLLVAVNEMVRYARKLIEVPRAYHTNEFQKLFWSRLNSSCRTRLFGP